MSFLALCVLSVSSTDSVGVSEAIDLSAAAVGAKLVGGVVGSLEEADVTVVGFEVSSGSAMPSAVGESVNSAVGSVVGSAVGS